MSANKSMPQDFVIPAKAGIQCLWNFPRRSKALDSRLRGNDDRRFKRGSAQRKQQGAALLEFALTFTVFLFVVLGTMELALTYFAWNRESEAARDGARYLIVSSPLTDLSTQSCSASAPAAITVSCSDGSCATLLSRLQTHAPFVTADRVSVRYGCSGAGNPSVPDENRVRSVTLSISGVPHPQVISALTGLGWTGPPQLPAVSVTRTGEDLYTPAP